MTAAFPPLSPELGQLALDRAAQGERLGADELESLYHLPLPAVAAVAHDLRMQRRDPDVVSFLIDRNINYTNICNVGCNFCAFTAPGARATATRWITSRFRPRFGNSKRWGEPASCCKAA